MATIKMAFLLVLFVTACCSPMLKVSGTEFGMKRSIGCVGDSNCSKEEQCGGAGRDGKCIHDRCRCLPPPAQQRKDELDVEADEAKQHCVRDHDCANYCAPDCQFMKCVDDACICKC